MTVEQSLSSFVHVTATADRKNGPSFAKIRKIMYDSVHVYRTIRCDHHLTSRLMAY